MSEYECDLCKDTGFVMVKQGDYEFAQRCQCYERRQAKRRIKASGISEEFQQKGFKDFDDRGDPRLRGAKERAQKYYQGFMENENSRHNSIILCGQVGAGKTHLGMAICNNLLNVCGVGIMYMAYRNAMTEINILYELVNYRYMNNKPMVISTEKLPDELLNFDEAVGSRILEMCRGNIILFDGKELNYRLYSNT